MTDFHPGAVLFGKPGKLLIAALGTTEPTSVSSTLAAGYVPLGYTGDGSTFNREVQSADVTVAEELDPIATTETGSTSSVTMELAELTYRNLSVMFNGGSIITPDGQNWTVEPPALGSSTRVMLLWQSHRNDADCIMRILFRQVLNVGSLGIHVTKGETKATIAANFKLEKPSSGAANFKIYGSGAFNPV